MSSLERRFVSKNAAPVGVQTREDGTKVIFGHGAVFYREEEEGTEYRLWQDVVERISNTAFDRAINEGHDARGLFNHDPNNLLGRTGAKTMRLSIDEVGLRYEIDIPDTQAGRDVAVSIERGDLTGSSFSFVPTKQTWVERSDGPDIRQIDDLTLYDTGPVTYPAYSSTTTGTRSDAATEDRTEYESFKARMKQREERIESLK